ncbi:hypothetical protein KR200_009880, partial [Drosophila serrata]
NQKQSVMLKSLREMSISKFSAGILIGIFHYFQFLGVISFRFIQSEDGYTVSNQNWLKWISAINRISSLCGYIYFLGKVELSLRNQIMQILHGIRLIVSIPNSLLIMGYQFFRGPEMMQLVNRFLRLFRKVRNLNKSKRCGFGGRRELVLILLKVTCLGHEFAYQWFMDKRRYTWEFLMEWLCNTYVISGTNVFMHIYCLAYVTLGLLCSEVNEYARHDLAAQLENLNPPISRRKRRKARCQLENCLALYTEIHAVNIAFQEFFKIPIVVAFAQKALMVAVMGYRVIIAPMHSVYELWALVAKHILDLLLMTLSVQGAMDQFKVIRRLNLEVYPVSDLTEFHTMLEVFYTHLNLHQFRVRIWGLCDVSNELFIIYISASVTWMVFIAQYTMQMKNV